MPLSWALHVFTERSRSVAASRKDIPEKSAWAREASARVSPRVAWMSDVAGLSALSGSTMMIKAEGLAAMLNRSTAAIGNTVSLSAEPPSRLTVTVPADTEVWAGDDIALRVVLCSSRSSSVCFGMHSAIALHQGVAQAESLFRYAGDFNDLSFFIEHNDPEG